MPRADHAGLRSERRVVSTSEVTGLRASTCISYFLHSVLVDWFDHPFLLLPSSRLQHIKASVRVRKTIVSALR